MSDVKDHSMTDWMTKGCERCRQTMLSNLDPAVVPIVAESIPLHAQLRRCAACGSWWEINEREAHVIDEIEARRSFPRAF